MYTTLVRINELGGCQMFELNAFDYEDIQLIPNKCIVNSRSECDTTVKLGKHTFKCRWFLQICKPLLMNLLLNF